MIWKRLLSLTFALAAICAVPLAHAVSIPAEYDFFTTDSASVTLPGFGKIPMTGYPWPTNDPPLFPLPAERSIANALFRIEWVDQHGNIVDPNSEHAVSQRTTIVWGSTPFDTIVRRNSDATIAGMGAQTDIAIEMLWLSLVSVTPVNIGGFDFWVHVGLSETTSQIVGKMRLTSETLDGRKGTADIGRVGDTDNPLDSTFLGLPVTFQVKLRPVLGGPIVQGDEGTLILHGACPEGRQECTELGPSGVYQVIPEPSSILLASLGIMALLAYRRRA